MNICHRVERTAKTSNGSKAVESANLVRIESHSDASCASVSVADTITLDETERHRRRIVLCSDSGIRFLLDLENALLLKNDDVLRLDDGRGIRVRAKPETLFAVYGRDATHLLRLAWHVGNRHLATQIMPDHLRIREDHVIRQMLEELGATVTGIECGFDPEGGAYGDTHDEHHHHHSHEH